MTTLKAEVTDPEFNYFLNISVVLTGFSENELLSLGMHEVYYYSLMKNEDQDILLAFLRESNRILKESGADPAALHEQVKQLLIPHDQYNAYAKRIILLWYTGILYDNVNLKGDPEMIQMLSPESYMQSLIWKVAETHPAGSKQPGYGSWAAPPL